MVFISLSTYFVRVRAILFGAYCQDIRYTEDSVAAVDEPEGDLDLLAKSLEAMNAEPDESKEERTGGSGHIGKMVFSCDNETLCAIAYIPESLKGQVDAANWLKTILAPYNGMLVKTSPVFSTGTIAVHPENGKSSREVRAEACHSAVKYLQQKGVYPEVDADSDDESTGFEAAQAEALDNL
ncbi:hypothetical protein ABOM_009964 [Aspergillus bombycis]|uniref:Uncharacterized protein n=1 Tax=Aspergillus bombycis TaxID=109264 RepID=A0A1F7ZQX8_9EURO|nr:hypothetical protein ABOM_009964 [Aspergillus bombycis]OGM41679.1 hypothetical protein ABOM_009964 [Aspergillus bombycis]